MQLDGRKTLIIMQLRTRLSEDAGRARLHTTLTNRSFEQTDTEKEKQRKQEKVEERA